MSLSALPKASSQRREAETVIRREKRIQSKPEEPERAGGTIKRSEIGEGGNSGAARELVHRCRDVAGFDDRAREWSELELHGGKDGENTSWEGCHDGGDCSECGVGVLESVYGSFRRSLG